MNPSGLPILAFVFKNLQAARDIFAGWRAGVGETDSHEKLRVSIITGISRDNPASYRVIIGTNLNSISSKPAKGHLYLCTGYIRCTQRALRTWIDSSKAIRKTREYLLSPAKFGPDGIPTFFVPELGILKRELYVRPAWQIERNDPDACGIDADDKIVIPDGVSDAQFSKTLAWKKRKDKERRPSSFSMSNPVRVGTPAQENR